MKKNYQGERSIAATLSNVFIVCFGIVFILIGWTVISHTVEGLTLLTIGMILLISWFVQPKKLWLYLLFLTAVSFGIKYVAIVSLLPPPIQDFKTVLDAARGLLAGDTSFNQLKYFHDWAYQTPFVLYDMIILKIKDDIQAIKLVNVLAAVGINLLIYLTLKGAVKERYAKIAATAFAFMPFPVIMNTWLSNQPMAALLSYIGIYFFVKKGTVVTHPIARLIICGVFVSLGNLMRPEGLVVLTAGVVWLLFEWFNHWTAENGLQFAAKAGALLLSYFLVGLLVSQLIIFSGINPQGAKNNNPYWKFTIGFNHQAMGMWNREDYDWLAEEEKASPATPVKDIQLPLIKYRIFAHPERLVGLFADKSYIFWAFPRFYQAFDYLAEEDTELKLPVEALKRHQEKRAFYVDYLNKTDVWLFLVFVALAIAGCIELGRRRGLHQKMELEGEYFFAFMAFTTAMVYLLIEVQPRYVYFIQPSIMILAAYGLQLLGGWSERK